MHDIDEIVLHHGRSFPGHLGGGRCGNLVQECARAKNARALRGRPRSRISSSAGSVVGRSEVMIATLPFITE